MNRYNSRADKQAAYNTTAWKNLRSRVLKRDNHICQPCLRTGKVHTGNVANHIKPHRGDKQLFWDESNIECVNKQCHDSWIAKQENLSEQLGYKVTIGCGVDGYPLED